VLQAAEAGVDIVDLAVSSMSGSTSQPNLNSVVAALEGHERDTDLNLQTLNEFSDYWEEVLRFYQPFYGAPRAGSGKVYDHEMPGGQYTNLKEQARALGLGERWPEVARAYSEVNDLFGDIVKVTPSSKVVGDMALFLVSRGIKSADVTKLAPGAVDFPESVSGMLAGDLGQPPGGWPADLQKVVLVDRKATTQRPGELAPPVDLDAKLAEFGTTDDLYSHLMYPKVFADFQKSRAEYDNLAVLPTPAFFYGMQPGEEISVEIDPGKVLFIKLLSIGEPNEEGQCKLFFELNGMPREAVVRDRSLAVTKKARPKGDSSNPKHAIAQMPGMVTEITTSVGAQVSKGDKLITLEAMKMLTSVAAKSDGVVKEVLVSEGESVDEDDLLVRLE